MDQWDGGKLVHTSTSTGIQNPTLTFLGLVSFFWNSVSISIKQKTNENLSGSSWLLECLESMKWMSQWIPPKPIALAQLQAPLPWNCEMAKGSVLATARPQPIPQPYWTVGSANLGCHMASSWCLLWFFSMWPFFTRRLARHPSSVVSGKSFKRSRAEPARAPRVWLLQLAQLPWHQFHCQLLPSESQDIAESRDGKGNRLLDGWATVTLPGDVYVAEEDIQAYNWEFSTSIPETISVWCFSMALPFRRNDHLEENPKGWLWTSAIRCYYACGFQMASQSRRIDVI